jgi:hypothetical protein
LEKNVLIHVIGICLAHEGTTQRAVTMYQTQTVNPT